MADLFDLGYRDVFCRAAVTENLIFLSGSTSSHFLNSMFGSLFEKKKVEGWLCLVGFVGSV